MNRLVCGDVGFGKTEVALRASAAAVFSGKQVVLIAPTTVLVRQHLATFRRRFGEFGVRVEALSSASRAAANRPIIKGVAEGSVGILVGTLAIASDKLRFHGLGLVIIDEEQRFGQAQKQRLEAGMHVVAMTAAPIPRTLQSALAGVVDLSVIATPRVRPDRFGLAELHQLRGRVGRGRRRGMVYLLTDPQKPLPPGSEKRLQALQTLEGLAPAWSSAPAISICAAPAIRSAPSSPGTCG